MPSREKPNTRHKTRQTQQIIIDRIHQIPKKEEVQQNAIHRSPQCPQTLSILLSNYQHQPTHHGWDWREAQ